LKSANGDTTPPWLLLGEVVAGYIDELPLHDHGRVDLGRTDRDV
jgi:hypothetical protein